MCSCLLPYDPSCRDERRRYQEQKPLRFSHLAIEGEIRHGSSNLRRAGANYRSHFYPTIYAAFGITASIGLVVHIIVWIKFGI